MAETKRQIKENEQQPAEKQANDSKQEDTKEVTIKELTETLQRLQAEFENYKKRVEKDTSMLKRFASADLIAKLLPVTDSFEFALKHTETDKEKFIKGIQMIYAQLFSVLESEGLKPIDAVGKKFDPYLHEVLLQEKSDKEEDTVLEELQKGYMINERVLRYTKVKIAKSKN